jgi:two-component system, NarL family, sensor kinase
MAEVESPIIPLIFAGIFLAAIMTTFVIAMVVLHRQRQVQNKQKLDFIKSEHEKILLNIENEIQQDVLTQIGRELHDNIGQLLSLAKLNFGSIKPEKHAAGRDLLNQIIHEVRGLSKTLNLDWVEEITLEEFIGQQLEKIQSTGFCSTRLHLEAPLDTLDKVEKLVLIRVIQETLNNAIKHASPEEIVISVVIKGNRKHIIIQDNGKGFDTSQKSTGSGMSNLVKRMETIGGEFYIQSEPGKGTLTKLTLSN